MNKIKYLFMVSPFIAVFVGLYLFHNAWASLLIYHAGIVTALVLFYRDISCTELFVVRSRGLAFVFVFLCLLAGPVLYLIWPCIQKPGTDLEVTMIFLGLSGWRALSFLLYFSTVHPVLEELYWRYLCDFKAPLISPGDLLFGLYHGFVLRLFIPMEFVILCVIGLVLVGRVWRYLKQRRNDHLLVFLSHAAADFSIFLSVLLLY